MFETVAGAARSHARSRRRSLPDGPLSLQSMGPKRGSFSPTRQGLMFQFTTKLKFESYCFERQDWKCLILQSWDMNKSIDAMQCKWLITHGRPPTCDDRINVGSTRCCPMQPPPAPAPTTGSTHVRKTRAQSLLSTHSQSRSLS